MGSDPMCELAQVLAAAKSRQDLPAAMKLFHHDTVLEAPSFGTMAVAAVAACRCPLRDARWCRPR